MFVSLHLPRPPLLSSPPPSSRLRCQPHRRLPLRALLLDALSPNEVEVSYSLGCCSCLAWKCVGSALAADFDAPGLCLLRTAGCSIWVVAAVAFKDKRLEIPHDESFAYSLSDSAMFLYDDVFASIDTKRSIAVLEKNELGELVKKILNKLARQLDASPVLQDL
ncbi:hypothetical protein Droror1_Dr00024304 [Drosera rotundifolia]